MPQPAPVNTGAIRSQRVQQGDKQSRGDHDDDELPRLLTCVAFVNAAASTVRRCLQDLLQQQAQHQHEAEGYVPLDGEELEALDSFGLCRGATAASA